MKEEESKSLISKEKKHSMAKVHYTNIPVIIRKLIPTMFLSGIIGFYISFFIMTYFSPLIFPGLLNYIPYIDELKAFHTFYDSKYKQSKGEVIIYIEFGVLVYLFIFLITSFFKVTTTPAGTIPDSNLWKIKIPQDANKEIQTEIYAISINKREKELVLNKNRLNDYHHSSENATTSENFSVVNERSSNDSVRYCLECKMFKPDRCHHCKYCNKCTLKMDHHCPWVGNCVGYNNYKYFILLLFYGSLISTYFVWIYKDVIIFLIKEEKVVNLKLMSIISLYMFLIMMMIFLYMFTLFHIWLTCFNYTTYEYIMKVVRRNKNQKLDICNDESSISRYDLGAVWNLQQVFGSNLLLWLIPLNFKENNLWDNGINFKLNPKFEYEVVGSV